MLLSSTRAGESSKSKSEAVLSFSCRLNKADEFMDAEDAFAAPETDGGSILDIADSGADAARRSADALRGSIKVSADGRPTRVSRELGVSRLSLSGKSGGIEQSTAEALGGVGVEGVDDLRRVADASCGRVRVRNILSPDLCVTRMESLRVVFRRVSCTR